ncbi:hypothetical protein MPTK1_3g11640 [Marchantia polymorpha subsp. ruderalis]|uniref:Uncharacterized protein n=2 Tax=Marchantia polymorpha TaxID=3197 RepID=A0AAF6AZS2_MARPO|nr:hypothetical protein MARPO_0037s0033 [Marchantia polymorpha]BBN05256.1 hypothetical protein Mp_3g11640 [Marchantia polymorpha subsp. ruderalis]|eukprot:PTQ40849.1 hypothetical protein MARPO_0037s0033 [Marchantia polymorpha]
MEAKMTSSYCADSCKVRGTLTHYGWVPHSMCRSVASMKWSWIILCDLLFKSHQHIIIEPQHLGALGVVMYYVCFPGSLFAKC